MALLSGVSWLCTALLLGYICFPPQKGYSFAHGYSPHDDAFRSHENVFDPLKSNHEDREDTGSVTSPVEEMARSNPDADHKTEQLTAAPSAPSVLSSDKDTSGSEHPFGLLLKEHTQKQTAEGVSFPTMTVLKQFIGRMKSSFLKPGSDLSRHFQTARDVIKNKLATDAQNASGEPDVVDTPDSAKDGKEQEEAGENGVWSESINTDFERSEQGPKNYQMQNESHHLIEPVDSAASSMTNSASNQGPGMDSAFHQHHLLAEDVSDNNEWSNNDGETFIGVPRSQHDDQSTHPVFSERLPSGSFFREDLSFPHSPDLDYHSSKTANIQPLTAGENIQPPAYTPPGTNSAAGHHRILAGIEVHQDFLKDEAVRVTHANAISAPKPNSYGRSIYVNTSRAQLPIPEYVPKQREREKLESISAQTSSPHRIAVKPLGLYPDDNHRKQGVHASVVPAQVKNDNFLLQKSVGSDFGQIGIFLRLAGHKVKSRNLGVRNILSGRNFRFPPGGLFGAKRQMGSFPTPQKQGFFLNGGYPGEIRAGHRQTFQPNNVWKHPAFVTTDLL